MEDSHKRFWDTFDPEKLQPKCLGEPRTAEDLEHARQQMRIIEEKQKRFCESQGIEYKDDRLFPELEE